jgi:periplasmic protein TonB
MPGVPFPKRPDPVAGQTCVVLSANAEDADHPVRGNVIPLRWVGDAPLSDRAPPLRVAEGDRPAPPVSFAERHFHLALILIGSLVVHAALFAVFRTEPEITASIGEDTITVEIIVGADAAAGTVQARSDVEPEQPPAIDNPQDEVTPEKPAKEEPTIEPETATTPAEEPIAPVQKEVTSPQPNVDETPPEAKPMDRPRPTPTPPAAVSAPAANSIGRGRMAGDANYQGLVAARLARLKRYPPDARRRREQGSALVSFVIGATGRVSSVRLVRGTGFAALDEEVQAMVRRASPFPAPPRGAEMSFTAPVSFRLN